MANIKTGPLVEDVRGAIGGVNFSRNKGGAVAYGKVKPTRAKSGSNARSRGILQEITSLWKSLTEAQRGAWLITAQGSLSKNKLGQMIQLTPLQLFTQCNINRSLIGLRPVLLPQLPQSVPMVTQLEPRALRSPLGFLDVLEVRTTAAVVGEYIIYATRPMSAGKFAPRMSEFKYIGHGSFEDTATNFAPEYNNIFGQMVLPNNSVIFTRVVQIIPANGAQVGEGIIFKNFTDKISFIPEYQSILDQAVLLNYDLPSEAQQNMGNQLIIDLKAAGIWNKLDVFYMFATDGSSQFATLNWKAPSQFQATLENSPIFVLNQGFEGDGVSAFINTNLNLTSPNLLYSLNDCSIDYFVFKDLNIGSIILDGYIGEFFNLTSIGNTAFNRINSGLTNMNAIVDMTGLGFKGFYRFAPSTVNLFNNLTSTQRNQLSSFIFDGNRIIFGAAVQPTDAGLSFYSIGSSLFNEHSFYYNIITSYLSNL